MVACSHLLKKGLLMKYKKMGKNGRIVKTVYGKPLLEVFLLLYLHTAWREVIYCVFQRVASQRCRSSRRLCRLVCIDIPHSYVGWLELMWSAGIPPSLPSSLALSLLWWNRIAVWMSTGSFRTSRTWRRKCVHSTSSGLSRRRYWKQ